LYTPANGPSGLSLLLLVVDDEEEDAPNPTVVLMEFVPPHGHHRRFCFRFRLDLHQSDTSSSAAINTKARPPAIVETAIAFLALVLLLMCAFVLALNVVLYSTRLLGSIVGESESMFDAYDDVVDEDDEDDEEDSISKDTSVWAISSFSLSPLPLLFVFDFSLSLSLEGPSVVDSERRNGPPWSDRRAFDCAPPLPRRCSLLLLLDDIVFVDCK
jgi:hypothetical protein